MKTLLLSLTLMIGVCLVGAAQTSATSSMRIYETRCHENDCLRNGWTTTGTNFELVTMCKNSDCRQFGWQSQQMNAGASDRSSWDVTCKAGGCFTNGWDSIQDTGRRVLRDSVTCKAAGCLVDGWRVTGNYTSAIGNVECKVGDCAHVGGRSFWRDEHSYTTCHDSDCYTNGWQLVME